MTVIWATLRQPLLPLLILLLLPSPTAYAVSKCVWSAAGKWPSCLCSARLIAILATKPTGCTVRVEVSFSEISFSRVAIPDNSK